jgi:hypothetical protein
LKKNYLFKNVVKRLRIARGEGLEGKVEERRH